MTEYSKKIYRDYYEHVQQEELEWPRSVENDKTAWEYLLDLNLTEELKELPIGTVIIDGGASAGGADTSLQKMFPHYRFAAITPFLVPNNEQTKVSRVLSDERPIQYLEGRVPYVEGTLEDLRAVIQEKLEPLGFDNPQVLLLHNILEHVAEADARPAEKAEGILDDALQGIYDGLPERAKVLIYDIDDGNFSYQYYIDRINRLSLKFNAEIVEIPWGEALPKEAPHNYIRLIKTRPVSKSSEVRFDAISADQAKNLGWTPFEWMQYRQTGQYPDKTLFDMEERRRLQMSLSYDPLNALGTLARILKEEKSQFETPISWKEQFSLAKSEFFSLLSRVNQLLKAMLITGKDLTYVESIEQLLNFPLPKLENESDRERFSAEVFPRLEQNIQELTEVINAVFATKDIPASQKALLIRILYTMESFYLGDKLQPNTINLVNDRMKKNDFATIGELLTQIGGVEMKTFEELHEYHGRLIKRNAIINQNMMITIAGNLTNPLAQLLDRRVTPWNIDGESERKLYDYLNWISTNMYSGRKDPEFIEQIQNYNVNFWQLAKRLNETWIANMQRINEKYPAHYVVTSYLETLINLYTLVDQKDREAPKGFESLLARLFTKRVQGQYFNDAWEIKRLMRRLMDLFGLDSTAYI